MEDKESGSLSQKPALNLIVELYQGAVTGSLKLERAPLQKAVYFRDGQILFAASNDPKDQLASILVEEGKLGPDQMQVAQARVSSGNPLAKVLTELGYISQRELADAARIKVEKILTDLYTWTEGTYQFATKSLPKGAIDLDLSTIQLIYASIRRIQDRDWILRELGSLDVVLSPAGSIDDFINEAKADSQASDVLRQADGVKSVKQIAALSSLGEFEVCKILAAGVVIGALSSGAPAEVGARDDAFSFPSEPPSFDADPSPPPSFGGADTVGLDTNPPSASDDAIFQPPTDDTVFQPPPAPPAPDPAREEEPMEKTVFDVGPGMSGGLPTQPIPQAPQSMSEPPSFDFGAPSATASELLIDEPEPESSGDDLPRGRVPPRPRGRRGGSPSGNLVGILKIAGVVALAAVAAFSVYYFVWPLVGAGGGGEASATTSSTNPAPTTAPLTAGGGANATPPDTPDGERDPRMAPGPRPAPPTPATTTATPVPTPTTTTPMPETTTTTSAPRPGPTPPPRPTGTPVPSGGAGRQLLAGGDISGAATAFQRELSASGQNEFTVAVGLYCNEENVGRIVESAHGSDQLYVLPTTIQGRRCFRVVWGTFDSRQAAEQSMSSLPAGIRAGDAAAVPLASVLR